MRLCTIKYGGSERAAVVTRGGIVPVSAINAHLGKAWDEHLYELLQRGISNEILRDAEATPHKLDSATVQFGPLYRHPRKILGHHGKRSRLRKIIGKINGRLQVA